MAVELKMSQINTRAEVLALDAISVGIGFSKTKKGMIVPQR